MEKNKVLIVEGSSDRKKTEKLIKEPIEIVCTNGTISYSRLDEFVERFFDYDVYILVDSDTAGEKLRKQLKREFPLAKHLYIDKEYREVATAPDHHLATELVRANIDVHVNYLNER